MWRRCGRRPFGRFPFVTDGPRIGSPREFPIVSAPPRALTPGPLYRTTGGSFIGGLPASASFGSSASRRGLGVGRADEVEVKQLLQDGHRPLGPAGLHGQHHGTCVVPVLIR